MQAVRRVSAVAVVAGLVGSCHPVTVLPLAKLDGRWVGQVEDRTRRIPMELNFWPRGDQLAGSMSLPTERLLGKPLSEVHTSGSTINFDLPAREAPLRFAGVLRGGLLQGEATGGGHTIAMEFRRARPVRRPYREALLKFSSGTVPLSGSLLMPEGQGPFPAVILIHGSSTPDRNDYRYFADLFARHGIAAFIYDKRPTGAETNGGTASLEVLASDVVAAAAMLEARKDIDRKQLGLWGYSQGGWVAPIAASRHPFAFIVACAAPGVSFAEVTLYADAIRLRSLHFSPAEIEQAMRVQRRLDEFIRRGGDRGLMQAMLEAAAQERWAKFTTLPRRIPSEQDRKSYLRWLNLDTDPQVFWRRVKVPVFLAEGSSDENVPPIASVDAIRGALASGGNTHLIVRVYRGANHNLEPAPSLEKDLTTWMLEVVHGR
ncbi:uncharacterized protein ACUXST_002228 [Sphingomonas sp. F9_3S_D5_B_2]